MSGDNVRKTETPSHILPKIGLGLSIYPVSKAVSLLHAPPEHIPGGPQQGGSDERYEGAGHGTDRYQ